MHTTLPPPQAGSASAARHEAGRRETRLSLRFHLALLCAGLILPILVFVGLILWQFASAERDRLEGDALEAARVVAAAIDRELTSLRSALGVLALSPSLQSGDLEGFHRQITEARRIGKLNAVLRTLDGQQILNASRPFGVALPRISLPSDAAAIATRQPVVSDLFTSSLLDEPIFAVTVPVLRDGEAIYLLSLGESVEQIRQILREAGLPANWTAAVIDRQSRILARNNRHEEFIGKPATKDLQDNTRGREGTWQGFTIDGQSVFGAYARSQLSDWRVAVGVRDADLAAPLRQSLWYLAWLGAGLIALSALLALLFGRHITIPMQMLAERAAALGRGEAVQPLATRLRDVAKVGDALAVASEELRERERERNEAEAALREFNATLEQRIAEAIADREKAEAQLRQAQKMEAVGRLTGGIAHDFNNLLTVVTGNLDMLRRRVGGLGDQRLSRYLDNALEGTKRAAQLTYRLLAFSRQSPLQPEVVDLNRIVSGMSELLRRTISENIAIETVLAGGLWHTEVDPNQLESAILNLAVNARDAMPDGGTLTLRTANVSLDEADAAGTNGEIEAGQYVVVSISDNGTGMTQEVKARVFEPFFTTKPVGKGTGLGLAQVYGFARQSGGYASVHSEPGEGTTIKLYFPRSMQTEERRALPHVEGSAASHPVSGEGEMVLVVEDEDMVRDFSIAALEDAGYRVLSAGDGPAALRLLEEFRDQIDLLFTDVVLTGPMDGRSVADEALKLRPDLKVLFTTGYTRDAIIHHGRLDEGVQLITKPFEAATLTERVRQLLDGR